MEKDWLVVELDKLIVKKYEEIKASGKMYSGIKNYIVDLAWNGGGQISGYVKGVSSNE